MQQKGDSNIDLIVDQYEFVYFQDNSLPLFVSKTKARAKEKSCSNIEHKAKEHKYVSI